jgi:hypothetical protein
MKSKTKLLFIVMAALMVFAATEVIAGDPQVQMSCTLVTDCGQDCWTNTPYSVAFGGQTTNGGVSTWNYNLSPNFPGGQNQLVLLSPVCEPDIGAGVSSGAQIIQPGEGDPTTNFGVGNFQDYVLRVATSNPYVYRFTTAVPTPLHNTSMQIKSGKTLYFCKNIAGPDCTIPGYVPVNLAATIKLGTSDICVTKDPTTGCINSVYDCDDPTFTFPLIPIYNVMVDQSALQWAGGETEARCPTVILYTTSSYPMCYTIGSGGNACKVCYCNDGPTPSAQCRTVNLNTCYGRTATTLGKCR